MPDLGNFSVAHDTLFDSDTGALSVIRLLDFVIPMGYREPTDEDPSRYITPPIQVGMIWWAQSEEEASHTFDQRLTIIAPDGKETDLLPDTRFRFGQQAFHRVRVAVGPIGARMGGSYRLVAKVATVVEEGTVGEFQNVAVYPFILAELPDPHLLEQQIAEAIDAGKGER